MTMQGLSPQEVVVLHAHAHAQWVQFILCELHLSRVNTDEETRNKQPLTWERFLVPGWVMGRQQASIASPTK